MSASDCCDGGACRIDCDYGCDCGCGCPYACVCVIASSSVQPDCDCDCARDVGWTTSSWLNRGSVWECAHGRPTVRINVPVCAPAIAGAIKHVERRAAVSIWKQRIDCSGLTAATTGTQPLSPRFNLREIVIAASSRQLLQWPQR